jgi:hypothetical protein
VTAQLLVNYTLLDFVHTDETIHEGWIRCRIGSADRKKLIHLCEVATIVSKFLPIDGKIEASSTVLLNVVVPVLGIPAEKRNLVGLTALELYAAKTRTKEFVMTFLPFVLYDGHEYHFSIAILNAYGLEWSVRDRM